MGDKLIKKVIRIFLYIFQDITLQTTFIIGNLVLVDKQLAETFLNQFNLHDILTDILEEYAKEHIQVPYLKYVFIFIPLR